MGSTFVWHSVLNVKVRVGAINQEKALVVLGAFSVTVKTDGLFAGLVKTRSGAAHRAVPSCRWMNGTIN